MKNFFIYKNKTPEELYKETRIREYINCYVRELQRHFDVSDKKMRLLLYQVYKDFNYTNFIKIWFYMLKSLYKKKQGR